MNIPAVTILEVSPKFIKSKKFKVVVNNLKDLEKYHNSKTANTNRDEYGNRKPSQYAKFANSETLFLFQWENGQYFKSVARYLEPFNMIPIPPIQKPNKRRYTFPKGSTEVGNVQEISYKEGNNWERYEDLLFRVEEQQDLIGTLQRYVTVLEGQIETFLNRLEEQESNYRTREIESTAIENEGENSESQHYQNDLHKKSPLKPGERVKKLFEKWVGKIERHQLFRLVIKQLEKESKARESSKIFHNQGEKIDREVLHLPSWRDSHDTDWN